MDTPDGDQSVQMTKDLLMKIKNDEAGKGKIEEDKSIRYCQLCLFILHIHYTTHLQLKLFFIWQGYLFLDTSFKFLKGLHYESSDLHGKLS